MDDLFKLVGERKNAKGEGDAWTGRSECQLKIEGGRPIQLPRTHHLSDLFLFLKFKIPFQTTPRDPSRRQWSLLRLLTSLIGEPASSISTLLYYSRLLPQNIVLERLVRHDLLDDENYLFHFLINFLRCFW
ncbi:hypothetical protein CIPAW_04G164400 [Carya illinoinensis]|uniref:Uncharacterized protein n=1 Tax=Carya illinoinensis TaxID=32201 RepID=A0A8T1QTW4_CARIL|nr:hypothetical protein CIPAW_04G164400 [Carya illinoinensis]